METENLLQELAKPFSPEHISWKPGSVTKDNSKCLALAYADLRAYMDRLDEVCGTDWSCRYIPWGDNRIICELTIQGITRSSTGEMAAQDIKNDMGGTVCEAQAFKRAAAMWGCGRALYDLPSVWIEFDAQTKRISKAGQAELDKRYQNWYKRAVGQPTAKPQPATIKTEERAAQQSKDDLVRRVAANGQHPEESFDNPWSGDAPAKPKATPAQLAEIDELGRQVYADEWGANIARLAQWASTGNASRLEDLLAVEADKAIGGLKKKLPESEPA